MPKVVVFKVGFCSSEGYLKPGRISTIKLLAVNCFRKKVCKSLIIKAVNS